MQPIDTAERIELGHTGLKVSRICFGAGRLLGNAPDDRGLKTARAILAGPANFLDTSRNYCEGRSEEVVGRAIRELGGLPEGFVISTKLDRDPVTRRFDAARARRSLEESLKTLGLERFEVLHLHDPEHVADLAEVTGPEGAVAELFKMKEEGLARAVGLAAGDVEVMMPILREWPFDVLLTHNRFTLVNRNAEEMIDLARARGTAILNAAPYNGGVLAKGAAAYPRFAYQDAGAEKLEPIKRIEAVCGKHGIPPGAAALQFSLRDERITSTVCGVSSPERIAETIEWAEWPIPEEAWAELMALPAAVDNPEADRIWSATAG
jgi:D-threo-aldose 1-dehydrogenase